MSGQRVSDERLAQFCEDNDVAFSHTPTHEVPMAVLMAWDLRDERAEAARLRTALIEAQECIDYGTRAGGAAEVLAHIATVLKGDEHATVERGVSATTGREMAVVAAAKSWRRMRGGPHLEECSLSDPELGCTAHALVAAVDRLTEAEGKGDESWQARRAELTDELWSVESDKKLDERIAAALDRAFEFGRGT